MLWDFFATILDSPLLTFSILLAVVICYYSYCYNDNLLYWKRRSIPSPPGNFPFIGHQRYKPNMFTMIRNFCNFQPWTKQMGKYYGIFEGQRKLFVTSDPQLIGQIFVEKFNNFKNRTDQSEHILQKMETDNIIMVNETWKEHRTRALPAFQMSFSLSTIITPLVIHSTEAAIRECKQAKKEKIEQCVERIEQQFLARFAYLHIMGCCKNIPITDIMQSLGYNNIESMSNYADIVANLYYSNIRHVTDWRKGLLYSLAYMFSVCFPGLTKFLHPLASRRPSPNYNIFLDLCKQIAMLQNFSENKCNLDFTKDTLDICDLIAMGYISSVVFIRAGHEFVNIYDQIADYPHVVEKIQDEIIEVCGTEQLDYQMIRKLKYMDAAITECLRLDPSNAQFSGATKRICVETTSLKITDKNGHEKSIEIEKGTEIRPDVFSLHLDSDIWGDDSREFRPERWIERQSKGTKKGAMGYNPAYLAFGMGPHHCIARELNMLRMKLILTVLFRQQEKQNDPLGTI